MRTKRSPTASRSKPRIRRASRSAFTAFTTSAASLRRTSLRCSRRRSPTRSRDRCSSVSCCETVSRWVSGRQRPRSRSESSRWRPTTAKRARCSRVPRTALASGAVGRAATSRVPAAAASATSSVTGPWAPRIRALVRPRQQRPVRGHRRRRARLRWRSRSAALPRISGATSTQPSARTAKRCG